MSQQTLSPKAQQTRRHIFETAMRLFGERGYEETTMRDIAAAAECSLGLAYRYFSSKDEIMLAHYEQLGRDAIAQIDAMPPGPIALLYREMLAGLLARLTPYRDALGAVFGAAMNPNSNVAVLGINTAMLRERTIEAIGGMVAKATDAPRQAQIQQIATILYSAQLLILLFWLYDRTPGQQATGKLLDFTQEAMQLLRPALILPPVARSVARLAEILEPVFGKGA
jgi:AcrR family transcriptional regulator